MFSDPLMAEDKEDDPQKIACLKKLVIETQKDPKDSGNWVRLADFYRFVLKDGLGSTVFYGKALNINPREGFFWLYRGLAYLSLNQPEKALSDFDKAVSLRQRAPAVWNAKGEALKALNEKVEAIRAYSSAIRLDSSDVRNWAARGYLYHAMGLCDKGNRDLVEAGRIQQGYKPIKCR